MKAPALVPFVLCALIGAESAAHAQSRADTEACLEAHVGGQRLVKESKLREAAEEFSRCAAKHCPKVVRRDCGKLAEETKAKVPSARLDVSDHRGMPVEDATIVIDGKATDAKSGDSIELDPGKHWARVIGESGRSVELTFDLEPGQRDVKVAARLPAPTPSAPTGGAGPGEPGRSSDIPTATWVSGGVALVGLVGFALFALSGSGKESDLDACKPRCTDHSIYDEMKRDYLIADVSLGIAVIAASLGAYFYVARDGGGEEAPKSATFVGGRIDRGGGRIELGTSF